MKNFKLMVLALLTMTCTAVSAQSNFFHYGKNNIIVGVNGFSANGLEDNLTGLRVGYSRLFELSEQAPVFLETAALIQVGLVEYETNFGESHTKEEVKYGALNIPVNVGYLFNIGESGFSIAPKAGLNFSFNAFGETEIKDNNSSATINWYDDLDAKRFTFGWQVGAEASYKHFVLGFQYGQDFNKLSKDGDIRFKTWAVNLAYRF